MFQPKHHLMLPRSLKVLFLFLFAQAREFEDELHNLRQDNIDLRKKLEQVINNSVVELGKIPPGFLSFSMKCISSL